MQVMRLIPKDCLSAYWPGAGSGLQILFGYFLTFLDFFMALTLMSVAGSDLETRKIINQF